MRRAITQLGLRLSCAIIKMIILYMQVLATSLHADFSDMKILLFDADDDDDGDGI